jgi:hypothetical protein
VGPSGVQQICFTAQIDHRDHSSMPAIFQPLLALIASVTDRQLARYVEFLKEESKILRTRIRGAGPHPSRGATLAATAWEVSRSGDRGADHDCHTRHVLPVDP